MKTAGPERLRYQGRLIIRPCSPARLEYIAYFRAIFLMTPKKSLHLLSSPFLKSRSMNRNIIGKDFQFSSAEAHI